MSLIGEAFVRIRPDDTGFRAEATKQVKRDLAGVERSAASSNRELSRFNRGALVGTGVLGGLGRAAAFASASFIGGAGLVYGLRSTIAAAEESQKVQAQLANALEQQNISLEANKAAIDKRTQALSQMSGFDDELITTTFINFVRRTGDVTKALNLNAIAVDVARGRNISLEASSALVTRASLGMAGSLRRVGIAAKDGASATELLNLLQQKYAGSAEAYGRTAAGAQERFRVAIENTQEAIGTALLPSITKALDAATKWLNNTDNQKKIQDAANETADKGSKAIGYLADAYNVGKTVLGPWVKLNIEAQKTLIDVDKATIHFVNGALPTQLRFLHETTQAMKDLAAAQKLVASGYGTIEAARAAQTANDFAKRRVDLPGTVKGRGFVGRPLTPAEQLAIALATNPNDVQALQAQRAQYQKALDYAQRQVDLEVGNTKQWADDIAFKAGQIQQINEDLNRIATDKAAKADAARLAAIAKLIPNAISGQGIAAGAFGRFQALIAGAIPGVVRGKGKADVSAALGESVAEQEAAVRTQIAEQQVTNDKKLIPLIQIQVKLAQDHLSLLKKVGASQLAQLQETLNIAQLRRRIRDINKQDAQDAFSIQDLFGEGGKQFAAYGSNVAPLSQPLSRQEAGGAAVRAAQAGKTIHITQNFIGARDAAQAIHEAANAARALR